MSHQGLIDKIKCLNDAKAQNKSFQFQNFELETKPINNLNLIKFLKLFFNNDLFTSELLTIYPSVICLLIKITKPFYDYFDENIKINKY